MMREFIDSKIDSMLGALLQADVQISWCVPVVLALDVRKPTTFRDTQSIHHDMFEAVITL